ncbi:MAG: hypothetical protein AAF483_16440 [Planctomycetota bacterium]
MKSYLWVALLAGISLLGCGPSDADFQPDPADIPNTPPVSSRDGNAPDANDGAPKPGARGPGMPPSKGS